MKSGIYYIKNLINNKVYVGSTNHFTTRFTQHLRRLRRGIHDNFLLQKEWSEYGEENFKFIKVIYVLAKKDLKIVEQFLINYKQSFEIKNGYNLSSNVNGGIPDYLQNKICQYDLEGNLLNTFKNAKVASEILNINVWSIDACIKEKFKKTKGFIFVRENNIEKNEKIKNNCKQYLMNGGIGRKNKTVDSKRNKGHVCTEKQLYNIKIAKNSFFFIEEYDLNNNLLSKFESIREAAKHLNISKYMLSKFNNKDFIYLNDKKIKVFSFLKRLL